MNYKDYYTVACSECGTTFETARGRLTCSPRCRQNRSRNLRRARLIALADRLATGADRDEVADEMRQMAAAGNVF